MTLPSSGTITLAMIQAEFGGPTPILLTNYYRGGTYVPNSGINAAVPTSGTILIPTNFYGAANFSATTRTYSTAGSFTETIPPGASTLVIAVWGGTGQVVKDQVPDALPMAVVVVALVAIRRHRFLLVDMVRKR